MTANRIVIVIDGQEYVPLAEVERLHTLLDLREATLTAQERIAEHLRGLLGEALDGWATAGTWESNPSQDLERIAEIRREEGLT